MAEATRGHDEFPPCVPRATNARSRVLVLALLLALFAGCRRDQESVRRTEPPNNSRSESAGHAPTGPASGGLPDGATACGAFDCLAFDTPLRAFEHVLDFDPTVLAVGEAHAQKGTEGIASSTKRFTDDFLWRLSGRANALVLELWLGEPKCGKVVETVKEQQKPVTQTQAKTNPNEIVALGDRAYALGIRPYPLKPSCEDYAPIADAGADAVPKMLELIARLSGERIASLVNAPHPDGGKTMVLAYGGALHNDVAPAPGKEGWSFGPMLTKTMGAKYIELDLIVGDFVRNEAPWTNLPWVKTYLSSAASNKTTLYRLSPSSFVLVFPKTR